MQIIGIDNSKRARHALRGVSLPTTAARMAPMQHLVATALDLHSVQT